MRAVVVREGDEQLRTLYYVESGSFKLTSQGRFEHFEYMSEKKKGGK